MGNWEKKGFQEGHLTWASRCHTVLLPSAHITSFFFSMKPHPSKQSSLALPQLGSVGQGGPSLGSPKPRWPRLLPHGWVDELPILPGAAAKRRPSRHLLLLLTACPIGGSRWGCSGWLLVPGALWGGETWGREVFSSRHKGRGRSKRARTWGCSSASHPDTLLE